MTTPLSELNRPVRAAIDDQAVRNEIYLSWGGLAESVAGLAISGGIWMLSAAHWGHFNAPTGPALMVLFLLLGVWYALAVALLRRGRGTATLPWVTPLLEACFPSLMMGVEAHVAGARLAAFGSIAPGLFAVAFSLAVLRLRWQVPLLVGLVGSTVYAALIAFVLIPGLRASDTELIYGSTLYLFVRPLVVVLLGITGAALTQRLRRSVLEVHQQVRSQELFGKYRLGDRLAAGGMGEVFRATYCSEGGFERPVAIKRIHPHLASNVTLVEAFRREAQLSSRLTHPNIVQVLDFGTEGGGYFLVMEFMDGVSLEGLLRAARQLNEPLPPRLVGWICMQVAHGLAFAHREARDVSGQPLHIIHRDLSPGNILLSGAGEVKLTDFGVAKALGTKDETVTTSVAGKLSYMAPEQVMAQGLDARCDLFALGVVLWEMLSGQRLFRGPNEAATISNVMSMEIPLPSTLRADLISPRWNEVVLRALERQRERRFPDASSMAAELGRLLSDEGPTGSEELGVWVARAVSARAPEPGAPPALVTAPGLDTTATVKARR